MSRKIVIASDHAGLNLKEELCIWMKAAGYAVEDLGSHCEDSCDYPVFANKVCDYVLREANHLGILICGSGVGMSMAANRNRGIRAALCTSEYQARYARRHNNANVLCLGERVTGLGIALDITAVFLSENFEEGRHSRRVKMLDEKQELS